MWCAAAAATVACKRRPARPPPPPPAAAGRSGEITPPREAMYGSGSTGPEATEEAEEDGPYDGVADAEIAKFVKGEMAEPAAAAAVAEEASISAASSTARETDATEIENACTMKGAGGSTG